MPQTNDPREFGRMLQEMPGTAKKILIEGDSWVSHPFLANIAVQFDQFGKGDFAILNLAQPGDTAKRMIERGTDQYKDLARLIVNQKFGYAWDVIFLSAAGNDIVGDEIETYVDAKVSGRAGAELLNGSYSVRIAEIARDYRNLIAFRDASTANPKTPLVTHVYSYLTPRLVGTKAFGVMLGKGWVQRYLIPKGITDVEEQKQIVREMLDQYYNALKALEQPGNNFFVVDTRLVLSKGPTQPNLKWWHDEIHPDYNGFKRVAEAIRDRMKAEHCWP